jgi:hypothetical protein
VILGIVQKVNYKDKGGKIEIYERILESESANIAKKGENFFRCNKYGE